MEFIFYKKNKKVAAAVKFRVRGKEKYNNNQQSVEFEFKTTHRKTESNKIDVRVLEVETKWANDRINVCRSNSFTQHEIL